jgi:hypothetical protein
MVSIWRSLLNIMRRSHASWVSSRSFLWGIEVKQCQAGIRTQASRIPRPVSFSSVFQAVLLRFPLLRAFWHVFRCARTTRRETGFSRTVGERALVLALGLECLVSKFENPPDDNARCCIVYIVLLITEGSLVYMTPREKLGTSNEI